MKKTLNFFVAAASDLDLAMQSTNNLIELLSEEESLQVRGGDKDFTPTSQFDRDKDPKTTAPFLLINF